MKRTPTTEIANYFNTLDATDSSFKGYHDRYWNLADKFDHDGVQFLESWIRTNTINDVKRKAAECVVKEWRDKQDAVQNSMAEIRANLSLWIAGGALLVSCLSFWLR